MKALVSHLEKLLDKKLEVLHEWLDEMENFAASQRTTSTEARQTEDARGRCHEKVKDMGVQDDEEVFEEIQPRRQIFNQPKGGQCWHRDDDDGLGGIKVKIPSFQGKNDPEAYLEWELQVEQIFSCHNYSKLKKVKLVALEVY